MSRTQESAVQVIRKTLATSVAASLAAMAGCAGTSPSQLSTEPQSIIASIGFSGTVTFDAAEATANEGTREDGTRRWDPTRGEVAIPITIVQNLPELGKSELARTGKVTSGKGQQLSTEVSVSVFGVSPPRESEYYLRYASLEEPSESRWGFYQSRTLKLTASRLQKDTSSFRTRQLELVLSGEYVKRLRTFDQLRIQVQVEDTYQNLDYDEDLARANESVDFAVRAVKSKREQLLEHLMQKFQSLRDTVKSENMLRESDDRDVVLSPTERFARKTFGVGRALDALEKPAWYVEGSSSNDKWSAVTADLRNAIEAERVAKALFAKASDASPLVRIKSTNAVRTITMIGQEDFRRDRLSKSVPIYEMTTFPLSSTQTEFLFGQKIERNFYVVGLTMQNSSGADRLINAGMIKVSGQALVRPRGAPQSAWFSIPVQVAPQSREHVYAILDDESVDEPRAVMFRGLEFVGALATAIATGFNGSEESIRALGIYTGIAIPELDKLVPDRMPGYKRNVVNYVMPNLVKIGNGTSTPPYFLFFSKTQLQGMVLDSQLFTQSKDWKFEFAGTEAPLTSAAVNVASLSFDSLEVPFEIASPESLLAGEPRITAAMQQASSAAVEKALSEQKAAEAEVTRLQAITEARSRIRTAAATAVAGLTTQRVEVARIGASLENGPARTALTDLEATLRRAIASTELLGTASSPDVNARWEAAQDKIDQAEESLEKAVIALDAAKAASPANEAVAAASNGVAGLNAGFDEVRDAISTLARSVREFELGRGDLDGMLAKAEAKMREARERHAREERRYNEFLDALRKPAANQTDPAGYGKRPP